MPYSNQLHSGPLRQRDIDRRDSTAEAFVLRHEQSARLAARSGAEGIAEFLPHLLSRISDFRNLHTAWNHVALKPHNAPGLDGRRPCDYCDDEVHHVLDALGHAIRSSQIKVGPERVVEVPKGPGRAGTRPLSLLNIPDRVAQRGAVQMIQPLLDPQFDSHSFGGRPGMSSWQALARACVYAQQGGRLVWVAADLANFFTTIPLGRLWPAVRSYLPDDQLMEMLKRLTARDGHAGLAQGAPLSTLLANLYAHHFLDRPWRKQLPTVPLLRFIDDLLITAVSVEEAGRANNLLQRLVQNAGLRLKDTGEGSVRDLAAGDHVDWLGYRLTWHGGRIRPGLPPSRVTGEPFGALLDNLEASLELAHEKPDSALRAMQAMYGMVDHAGPCWCSMQKNDKHDLYERMAAVAADQGFEEVPFYLDFRTRWGVAYERWRCVRHKAMRPDQLVNFPSEDVAITSKQRHRKESYLLYTDGSWSRSLRRGGWAYRRLRRPGGQALTESGRLKSTSNNRAEMHAVIHGLQAVPAGAAVTVVSDSMYVVNGMGSLPRWKVNGWRAGRQATYRPVANLKLWMQLDRLLATRHVSVRWVRGHSGNAANDRVHRLAQQAAGISDYAADF